jgi:glycerol-3-phosphate dehydrogenase (NAD(P)+)
MKLQELFSTDSFRVYSNLDVVGVQLGGALKNVMAIASGISDGMKFGTNTRAALITRGLAEMTRLGMKAGANPLTFAGLAGLGDLVLTCTGDLSRNRQVGLRLGAGETIENILDSMTMVAEGVKTSKSVHQLAAKYGVEMPITEQVYRVIYKGLEPGEAVKELMMRPPRHELYGVSFT